MPSRPVVHAAVSLGAVVAFTASGVGGQGWDHLGWTMALLWCGLMALALLPPLMGGRYAVRASRAFERAERDRRALMDRLVEERMDERLRIANELHAGLLQDLVALQREAESVVVAMIGCDDASVARASLLATAVSGAISDVCDVIADVGGSTADEHGLVPALQHFAELFARRTRIDVIVDGSGVDDARIPAPIARLLYECGQEALTNVGRHARAGRVWIELRHEGAELELGVRDDGVGWHNGLGCRRPRPGLGLHLMRDRLALHGGTCWVDSSPGEGVRLVVRVPSTRP
jgi:signal transduction histidine kinase